MFKKCLPWLLCLLTLAGLALAGYSTVTWEKWLFIIPLMGQISYLIWGNLNMIKKYLPEILCFYAIMIIVGVGAGSTVAPGGWWKGLCFLLPLGTLVILMELDKKK